MKKQEIIKCPKCNTEFEKYNKWWDERKFCSRKCSNSHIMTKETRDKISKGVKKHNKEYGYKSPKDNMSVTEWDDMVIKLKIKRKEKFLQTPFNEIAESTIRKRVLLEQDSKCNRCELDKWQGEDLTLELEHKDGNHNNDERSNLECLCPNCHSLTSTWRGRNKKGVKIKKKKMKEEEICRTFLEVGNIRQTLLKMGFAAKGANYGTIKRVLTLNGIKY